MPVAAAFAVASALGAAMLTPRRYVVDGLSMAPGLMPGDVVSTGWLPVVDRLSTPARLTTWVVKAPEAERAIKRVVGLPREDVGLVSGDLVIDGTPLLKPPAALAEVAVAVDRRLVGDEAAFDIEPGEILDDAAFAREVNRPLEPVADVGFTAILRAGAAPGRVVIDVDALRIGWRFDAHERVTVVAGRLDHHLVGVAWRARAAPHADGRRPLPADVPARWSVARPRPAAQDGDSLAPRLRLRCDPGTGLETVSLWRDAHLRPAHDGRVAWSLGPDEYLLLGDFPTGSVDSRQWGPLPRGALLHQVNRRR